MKPPTRPMGSGETPYPERLKKSAEALYALLTSPFERSFDSLGYKARLSMRVSRDSPVFGKKSHESFMSLTGKKIDKGRNWNVTLGHIPETDTLGIVNLEVPTQSNDHDDMLIFQRFYGGQFLLLEQHGNEEPTPYLSPLAALETMLNDTEDEVSGDSFQYGEQFVRQVLYDAGYSSPDAISTPNELQLHMAETMQNAVRWAVQETVTTLTSDNMQITTTRLVSDRSGGTGSELGRGRTNRRRDPRRFRQIDAHIEAVIEDVNQTGTTRDQLVIIFEGEDYTIKKPTIIGRSLKLDTSDATVANYGNGQYIATKNNEIQVTPELLDTLAANIVTDIIGD